MKLNALIILNLFFSGSTQKQNDQVIWSNNKYMNKTNTRLYWMYKHELHELRYIEIYWNKKGIMKTDHIPILAKIACFHCNSMHIFLHNHIIKRNCLQNKISKHIAVFSSCYEANEKGMLTEINEAKTNVLVKSGIEPRSLGLPVQNASYYTTKTLSSFS